MGAVEAQAAPCETCPSSSARALISVMCPTRLRLDALTRSLASLDEQARGGELEFLLAVDPDDDTDYEGLGTVVRFSERVGYTRLHEYYNVLAVLARGDWLLLWNDDCIMTTTGWNQIVEECEPNVILSPSTVHAPLCTFPIVPRRFIGFRDDFGQDAGGIGHFSLNAHCDTWWQEIGEALGILEWPPIWVDHDRADITGRNHDSVYLERVYQTDEFNAMRPQRMADAAKIRELLCARS